MTGSDIQALVDAVTFIMSVGVSAFISGTHWGEIRSKMNTIDTRLAKIEGMFTLRWKGEDRQ